jgi:hypothetical protein
MRDGTHQNLPMSQDWRTVLRFAGREADRGRVSELIRKTVLRELQTLIPNDVRTTITVALELLPVIGCTELTNLLSKRRQANWMLALLDADVRAALERPAEPNAIESALKHACQELLTRADRQMEQHVASVEPDREVSAVMKVIREGYLALDLSGIVASFLRGDKRPRRVKDGVQCDEDLQVSSP